VLCCVNCLNYVGTCKQDGINIKFDRPQYLVIDSASDAEYNGAQSVFGETCQIAMCWFHVFENIKKRRDVPSDLLIPSFFIIRRRASVERKPMN
jgi:hypothetical protein